MAAVFLRCHIRKVVFLHTAAEDAFCHSFFAVSIAFLRSASVPAQLAASAVQRKAQSDARQTFRQLSGRCARKLDGHLTVWTNSVGRLIQNLPLAVKRCTDLAALDDHLVRLLINLDAAHHIGSCVNQLLLPHRLGVAVVVDRCAPQIHRRSFDDQRLSADLVAADDAAHTVKFQLELFVLNLNLSALFADNQLLCLLHWLLRQHEGRLLHQHLLEKGAGTVVVPCKVAGVIEPDTQQILLAVLRQYQLSRQQNLHRLRFSCTDFS